MELLINIIGGVALLIWGVRMVRTGLSRSLGGTLHRWVSRSAGNRFSSWIIGFGITGLLQSSTATALIASSFAGKGLMTTAMGLALMLGADVGSTLIVQALSFNVAWLSPVLIAFGVALFVSSSLSTRRAVARAAIGLGLILLSLTLIAKASVPLRETEGLNVVLRSLTDEILLTVLIMAAVTWLGDRLADHVACGSAGGQRSAWVGDGPGSESRRRGYRGDRDIESKSRRAPCAARKPDHAWDRRRGGITGHRLGATLFGAG
jgi:phosphate:Na+ symporter